jgi:hypothetical protein
VNPRLIPTPLLKELRANGTLRQVADHLAIDLLNERERLEQAEGYIERVEQAFMGLQVEILAFMRKHEIPGSAGGSAGGCSSDGSIVVRTRAIDPQNIMANVIWLRDILKWAEGRDDLAEAYENPDSERTT